MALLSADEIARIVERLAGEIEADHKNGVMLVGLLKGSVFLVADLIRALSVPSEIDFFALSSYAPGERRVRILKDLSHDVSEKDVVIVADIVDTGLSIGYVVELVRARARAPLRSARCWTVPRAASSPSRCVTWVSRSRTTSSSAMGSTSPSATAI